MRTQRSCRRLREEYEESLAKGGVAIADDGTAILSGDRVGVGEDWGEVCDDEFANETAPLDNILDLEAAREVALFQAAARNDIKSGSYLIAEGAIINCQDADNLCTALHVACSCGNLSVAELLVRAGADMNLCNKDGKKATDLAQQNGYRDIVLILNLLSHDLC